MAMAAAPTTAYNYGHDYDHDHDHDYDHDYRTFARAVQPSIAMNPTEPTTSTLAARPNVRAEA